MYFARLAALAAALISFAVSTQALAETCVIANTDTDWTGPTDNTPPRTGCTPSADDDFEVPGGVSVDVPDDRVFATSGSPLTGNITVQSGGALNVGGNVQFHHTGVLTFQDGSDGVWQGDVLFAATLMPDISYPTPTTIMLSWEQTTDPENTGADIGRTPWVLCDTAPCGRGTVHAESASEPATLIYFDSWEKVPPQLADRISSFGFTDPAGAFFEVVDVTDESGGGVLDAITIELPRIGANAGDVWFGAGGVSPGRVTLDGTDRCYQCLDDGVGTRVAANNLDNAGKQLRNAIAEGDWTLDTTPWVYEENATGQVRRMVRIAAADTPFTSDNAFDGFLACVDAKGTCQRIIQTHVNYHSTTGEAFQVLGHPTDWEAGDELSIYYARPTFGDTIIPVNPINVVGGGTWTMRVNDGSLFGITAPLAGWHLEKIGPPTTENYGVRFENGYGLTADLILIEDYCDGGVRSNEGRPWALSSQSGSVADLAFRDVAFSRMQFRFPDCDTNMAGGGVSTGGLDLEALNPADGDGDLVDIWSGFAIRKIRTDGVGSAVSINVGGQLVDCVDQIWAQDVLVLHTRDEQEIDGTSTDSNDTIETGGATGTCNFDRAVVTMRSGNTGFNLRCRDCPDSPTKWFSSLIVIGDMVSGNSQSSSFGWTNTDNISVLSNSIMTAELAANDPVARSYTEYTGYFSGPFWPWAGCQSAVGLYTVGFNTSANIGDCTAALKGSRPRVNGGVFYLDNYHANIATVSEFYMFQTNGSSAYATDDYTVERILWQVAANVAGSTTRPGIISIANGTWSERLTIDDITAIVMSSSGSGVDRRLFSMNATFSDDTLAIGPNVWGVGVQRPECHSGSTINSSCLVTLVSAAQDGVGSNYGVNRGQLDEQLINGAVGRTADGGGTLALSELSLGTGVELIEPWNETADALLAGCSTYTCDIATARPNWSGIVLYEWPHAWVTYAPSHYGSGLPALEWLPPYLARRAGLTGGGGGSNRNGAAY